MKVVIVIPTYNEAENVSRLLPMLQEEFSKITKHEMHVLFVDGNSTDRTQEIVLGYSNEHPWVHLMVEKEKEGIGAAYMKGFKKAMRELSAEVVMEMDGDLQHDPKEIVKFLDAIDNGADYVIGSRYIKGGSIPQEWEGYRKFLSWGGSTFARVVLGIWNVKDFTTGFKASRVKGVLDQIDFNEVRSAGFAYKIDLLYKTYKLGAKIVEVPITFGLRDRGSSKIEQNTFLDSLKVVLSIRIQESQSFLKFAIVGFAGTIVDFTFANLLKYENIQGNVAATASALIAMATTFALNNLWSFNHSKIKGSVAIAKKFVPYTILSTIPVILRYFIVGFSENLFGDTFLVYNLAIVFSVGIGLFWNYFTYSKFIWGKKKEEVEEKKETTKEDEVQARIKAKLEEMKKDKEEALAKAVQQQGSTTQQDAAPSSTQDTQGKDPEVQKRIEEKMKEIRGEA